MFLLIREIASLYIAHVTAHSVGDPKGVRALHKVLKYIDRRKTTIVRNGFGKWWLGNLVTKLGGKWEDYRCRGEIVDYSLEGDILIITQMTAWCEQEGVRRIIQEKPILYILHGQVCYIYKVYSSYVVSKSKDVDGKLPVFIFSHIIDYSLKIIFA